MYIKRFYCPTCGSLTTTNGSRELHKLLRRSYAQCSNHLCSASWQLSIEVTASMSPTSSLYAADAPVLPDAVTSDDIAHELALQFLHSHDADDIDSILGQCPIFLQSHTDIDAAMADVITRQVLVSRDSSGYSSWLALGSMGSSIAPVVVE
ncbi:ogr/Delta-like zinc finger family protein [Psychrobacter sp.]|uniref:ogr/Delta-like zinc finger family protein n=1 Tax=Psychrobacter sp. TaxID=56811 RepID=UPI003BAF2A01